MNKAIVVTLSARTLSMGMTKLSGSHPFLKVDIEIIYDNITIMETAIRLVIKSIDIKLKKLVKDSAAFITKDKMPRITNITIDEDQALKIFFA
jgi:hypothetical protein